MAAKMMQIAQVNSSVLDKLTHKTGGATGHLGQIQYLITETHF